MSFKLTNDASLDLLRTLGDNKLYYLSKGNEVKEANGWMRIKCFLGIPSARQKVADLVNAVRESLINAAGGNQDGAVNLDSFRNIDQNKLMKGVAIKDIANRFCVANQEKILMAKAASVAAGYADACASEVVFGADCKMDGNTGPLTRIFKHAFKSLVADKKNLPIMDDAFSFVGLLQSKRPTDSQSRILDEEGFRAKLASAAGEVKNLLKEIMKTYYTPVKSRHDDYAVADKFAKDINALLDEFDITYKYNNGIMTNEYADQIIKTLFNDDGTLKGKTLDDLPPPSQAEPGKVEG